MKKKILMFFSLIFLITALASCSTNLVSNKVHKIQISDTENGTIEASVSEARASEVITVKYIPDAGYSVEEDSKVYNYIHFIKNDTFIMPDSDVVLSAIFNISNFSISVSSDIVNGNISVQNSASAGSLVEVTVNPKENYTLETLKYNQTPLKKDDSKYVFTMPKADVVINATFVLSKELPLMNVSYGSNNNLLDIYLPEENITNVDSMLIYLHSGFWISGTRKEFSDDSIFSTVASDKNIAVVSVDYSLLDLSSETSAINFDKMIDDITKSIEFSKERLKTWGIDITKAGLSGYSAGGHLAMLYSYKYASQSSVPITMLNTYCAPTDFTLYQDIGRTNSGFKSWLTSENTSALYENEQGESGNFNFNGIEFDVNDQTQLSFARSYMLTLFGKLVNSKFDGGGFLVSQDELIDTDLIKYSPIEYVDSTSVPSLIIYAENDGLVQIEQGSNLESKLNLASVINQKIVIPNSNHDFYNTLKTDTVTKETIKNSLYNYIDLYL